MTKVTKIKPRHSRRPQNINKYIWYYEENGGLLVVVSSEAIRDERSTDSVQFRIPWRKLKTSLRRHVGKS